MFVKDSCCPVTKLCRTLCNPIDCSMPGFPVPRYLLEFAQVHMHWISDAIQPSHPLLPCLLLPSIFPSIRVFSNELAVRIRWPTYCIFNFSISSSIEYSRLISFKVDCCDLLAVQGTLQSLLQHHSLKASILWHAASFMVQFSHLYITTGKAIALTRWIFISKVMSLLFNTLSRFVIALFLNQIIQSDYLMFRFLWLSNDFFFLFRLFSSGYEYGLYIASNWYVP